MTDMNLKSKMWVQRDCIQEWCKEVGNVKNTVMCAGNAVSNGWLNFCIHTGF